MHKVRKIIAAGWLALFCSTFTGALTGRENVQALKTKMDRYLSLVGDESGGPLSPQNMKEALAILDSYEKLMRMPSYMMAPRFNHDPANGDQTRLLDQVNFVKLLTEGMIATQRSALSFQIGIAARARQAPLTAVGHEMNSGTKAYAPEG